jgi:GlcNAc-P-P-Und epimerase
MEKLLLTGGSGFLGSRIAETLKKQYKITLLQRSEPGSYQDVYYSIQCDLSEEEIPLGERMKWDMVVHAAGRAHVVESESSEELFHKVNVTGTRNLLNSIRHQSPNQFVYISSVAVYGADEGEEIGETHPLNATDPYGLSKIEAEKEVMKWAEETATPAVILRPALIAGPNPPGNLGRMMEAIQKGRYFGIGKGEAKKSMVWADDIASLIGTLNGKSGIYNLSDGYHPAFFELERVIEDQLKTKIMGIPNALAWMIAVLGSWINGVQNRVGFPLDRSTYKKITKTLTFSSAKAEKELDWQPNEVLKKMKE